MHAKAASLLLLLCSVSAPCADEVKTLAPGLRKLAGTEPTQNIQYVRIFFDGVQVAPGSKHDSEPLAPATHPVLIAQCTKDARGKLRFELMANFGAVDDIAYYPPWKSTGPDDIFPPRTEKTDMVFDFFGYTKVKPVKRQWEKSLHVPGEARYNPPSSGSHNLEEIAFYLQYLKALPTLRITSGAQAAQWDTTPWQAAVHNEPLCWASGV